MKAIVVACLFAFASCDDAQNEFSNFRCYLVIENQYHQNAVLASAMNANATGVFCTISHTYKNGIDYFHVENSDGMTDDIQFNGYDARRSHTIGMNNGLIVGYGAFSNPLTFYAYDRECPNCFNPDAVPLRSHPLSIASSGMARCNTCKRTYNMNSGGNIASGDGGRKLNRYHARTTGTLGVLTVN